MNSSITITLPWLTNSTNSVMRRPRPVSVMPPTMMPAVAVATPMPIMLREPSVRPPMTSRAPCIQLSPTGWWRSIAISGRCVSISTTSTAMAQNADSAGDISSTIRHQISVPIGIKKCRPARTVGQVSSGFGLSMSMSSGRSGLLAACCTLTAYSASTTAPTAHGAAAPSAPLIASSR